MLHLIVTSLQSNVTNINKDLYGTIKNIQSYGTGYIDVNGNIHYDSSYNCKYVKVECHANDKFQYKGKNYVNTAPAVVWFNSNGTVIGTDGGGSGGQIDEITLTAPDNTAYAIFASFQSNSIGTATLEIVYLNNILSMLNGINIVCIGDSTTEGMATTGAHYAVYGQDPYPARLKTILVDNGYINAQVNNYGHGGERLQDVACRLGGWPTVLTEDIVLPADGSEVSLGTYSLDSYGRVQGTKLKLLHNDQYGDDYSVYLTQVSHDTNPIIVNGKKVTMVIHDSANYLKQEPSDEPLTLKAGTILFTSDNRNADINIIYIGINGSTSINLETWLAVNKRCGEMNGGKYIILGSTHPLFDNWADVVGSTTEEKHSSYSRKCTDELGIHFIDLYKDFFDRGYEILEEYSMLDRFTETQKQEIYNDLNQRIVPPELSYDGAHEGNVHLNKEGYQIIAVLVFERLKELNYIG